MAAQVSSRGLAGPGVSKLGQMVESDGWKPMQNRHYRMQELYMMRWQLELNMFRLFPAQFGGPIAAIRDTSRLTDVSGHDMRPSIQIFSSTGQLITSFHWDRAKIIEIGWTKTEEMIVVTADAHVYIYGLHSQHSTDVITEFSFPNEVKEQGVHDCRIWSEGVVVMTRSSYEFWTVQDFKEPRPRQLADCALVSPPTSWAILEPGANGSGTKNVEVLVGVDSGTIIVVDADGVHSDSLLLTGPFGKIVPASNGKHLALWSNKGNRFFVMSSNFGKPLSEIPDLGFGIPQQIVWCGTDSALLYWHLRPTDGRHQDEYKLIMVGPAGAIVSYSFSQPLKLVPEIDGVRIISASKCEFLQIVPEALESVLRPDTPAAVLIEAYTDFKQHSPKADESIRALKKQGTLEGAVDTCIEAAAVDFSDRVQKHLLHAATFGKSFLDTFYSDTLVNMCKSLRILNAIRHPDVGIPLTYTQYQHLKPEALTDRLITRNHHLLAWRICDYLGQKGDTVLVHWACAKVRRSAALNPNQVCRDIVERLQTVPGISYAKIASTAHKSGNPELATMLLDYEPRAADQVPLLISMQQYDIALLKAIESGDTDLVYLVLLGIRRNLHPEDFFARLRDKPAAVSLLIKYCRQQDRGLLKDIYLRENRTLETGQLAALEAYQKPELDSRINGLDAACHIFKEGGKDTAFEAKATQDQIALLRLQRALEKRAVEAGEPPIKLVDCSLSDTLYRLIALGYSPRADKVRSDFKVPDSRYWWIKIRGLTAAKAFDELFAFSKEKKSPIGYRPFVDVCHKVGANTEALKYVPRIEDPSERLNAYIKLESFTDAADVAFQMKSLEALQYVRSRCNHGPAFHHIDGLISQLQR